MVLELLSMSPLFQASLPLMNWTQGLGLGCHGVSNSADPIFTDDLLRPAVPAATSLLEAWVVKRIIRAPAVAEWKES